jgi:DNA repair exonuclease SbcCD nuclease subunit
MARILCVGDLHLSHSRLDLCKKVLSWIEQVSIKEKVDAIVYLGDEHDSHATIRAECNSIWSNHLANQLKLSIPIYWLLGNHAQFKPNDSTYNALQPFLGWSNKNLHPIIDSCEIDGFGFVPYLNSISWKEATEGFESKIVFTHNTFVGADFGFKVADGGILLSDIASDLVVSGHIHKRQTLQCSKSQVVYPGTPYGWSAHDVDQIKGLSILDTETYKFSFIESMFPKWRKIEVDLSVSSEVIFPNGLKEHDHILVKFIGLRSEVKAILASSCIEDLKQKYSSISVSTEFIDSARLESNSIHASTAADAVEMYMNGFYKGSAPVDLVKAEVLKALGVTL